MSSDYECDNYDDCGDNSDEQGCGIVNYFDNSLLSTPPVYTILLFIKTYNALSNLT